MRQSKIPTGHDAPVRKLGRATRAKAAFLLACAVSLALPFSADAAQSWHGKARIVDADTVDIGGIRFRLHGIDAPEKGQKCLDQAGEKWRCGKEATNALTNYIGNADVTCVEKDRDRYNRVVAVCSANGVDLNGWLVRNGWAVAYTRYSQDYVGHEKQASFAAVGIWKGEFIEPAKWRRGARLGDLPEEASTPSTVSVAVPSNSSATCLIKGNISKSGKIYHMPDSPWYEKTKISENKGERWFCTELEAQAAGWRKAGTGS